MLYIGVDLGTSAVKLLLMDENGNYSQDRIKRISAVFSASGLVRAEIRRTGLPRVWKESVN